MDGAMSLFLDLDTNMELRPGSIFLAIEMANRCADATHKSQESKWQDIRLRIIAHENKQSDAMSNKNHGD